MTVIGARCKQSGMIWSETGAEIILGQRCINTSRRLDEFWNYRPNAKSAANACLPLAAEDEEICLTPNSMHPEFRQLEFKVTIHASKENFVSECW